VTRRPLRPAASVGTGILISRVTGLARDVAVAGFLGTRFAADAYWAAIKIPNIIRNLLGEGTLSAAFVPVYSASLAAEGPLAADASRRLARSVLGGVILTAALLSGLGVLLLPGSRARCWQRRTRPPGISRPGSSASCSRCRAS
jgi:putative peptidoglycan lipid II flippase